MKTIATIFPEDVKPQPYHVRCLVATCFRTQPSGHSSLDAARAFAEIHARDHQHAVVIELEDGA